MGNWCSRVFGPDYGYELREMRAGLINILRTLTAEDLLSLAVDDVEVYDVCRLNEELRTKCIVAAVRRYHQEKFFYEEVHNRTADYMKLLDFFTAVQDELDRKRELPLYRARELLCPCIPIQMEDEDF